MWCIVIMNLLNAFLEEEKETQDITEIYEVVLELQSSGLGVITSVYSTFESQKMCIGNTSIEIIRSPFNGSANIVRNTGDSLITMLSTSASSVKINYEMGKMDEHRRAECIISVVEDAKVGGYFGSSSLEETSVISLVERKSGFKGFAEATIRHQVCNAAFESFKQEDVECVAQFCIEEARHTTEYLTLLASSRLDIVIPSATTECFVIVDIIKNHQHYPSRCLVTELYRTEGTASSKMLHLF